MSTYNQILVAVDLTDDSKLICQKALEIAQQNQSDIVLIHVLEFVYQVSSDYDPLFYPTFEQLAINEDEILKIAQNKMDDLLKSLIIGKSINLENKIVTGSPKTEVIRLATQKNVDLIVCGSHGRSGIELLLGSTANAILHHSPCDVLAVRTRKASK